MRRGETVHTHTWKGSETFSAPIQLPLAGQSGEQKLQKLLKGCKRTRKNKTDLVMCGRNDYLNLQVTSTVFFVFLFPGKNYLKNPPHL